MNIVEEIKEISDKLDEIDDYTSSLPKQLSVVDEKTSDILHLIENNKISAFGAYRLVKELRGLRIERRKIKNDMEITRTFIEQRAKILSTENRKFMLQAICKKEKGLDTTYKNRQYKEGELEAIIK